MRMIFIVATLIIQILLLLVHYAVYSAIVAAFGIGSGPFETFFLVSAFVFTSASLLSFWFENAVVRAYYKMAAYWFGLVHFLLAGAFFFVIFENFGTIAAPQVSHLAWGVIAFSAAIVLYVYAAWNSGRAQATKVAVTIKNLPDFWRGKTIVLVSDLHLGNVRGSKFAAKVAAKIAALRPNAVCIAGDLFDGVKCDPAELIKPLCSIEAPQGIYFASGNHEEIHGTEGFLSAVRDAGITVLADNKIEVQGLVIAGVSYHATSDKQHFEDVLAQMNFEKGKPVILIKHSPSNPDISEKFGVSLVLSGHTHKGQIFPITLITRRIYGRFNYGLAKLGNLTAYTSSGVGTWGPPLRLGTKSEIVAIELR